MEIIVNKKENINRTLKVMTVIVMTFFNTLRAATFLKKRLHFWLYLPIIAIGK